MSELVAPRSDDPYNDDVIAHSHAVLHAKALWGVEDMALYLSRSPESIRTMRKLGNLPPASKVGKRLYWIRAEVEEWVKANQEPDDYDPVPPPKPRR